MDYASRINESQQKVYEKAVATKILDLMDKLRTSSNENDRKRWIWELLQNAKDVKNLNRQGVDVIVDLATQERTLVFKHNGRCFSTDNITFLIEQVSTKERDPHNTEETGKFGTGFLTTHLLSEIVEVRGVVKDDDLPYRKFCITLDRKSAEIPEIIASLKKSIKELRGLTEAEDYKNYKEDDFNTSFTYHLDEDGLETAFIGIDDLKNCLPLTLVFLPALKSVEIQHESTVYYSVSNKELPIEVDDLSLRICRIENCTIELDKSFDFISLKGLDGEIAIPVTQQDNTIFIEDLSQEKVPKIFCDFPLVGSEKFGVPFFINSSYFHPTEPRDGIFLTDKNHPKINLNKQILETLTDYYIDLIDCAVIQEWENLYQLANISMPPEIYWLSTEWYKENILKPIQDKIYVTAIVKRENGSYISLKNEQDNGIIVDIPFHKRKEIRDAIWDLVADVKFFILPAKTHIDNWYQIFRNNIWDDSHRLTISQLSEYISNNCTKIDDLQEVFEIPLPIEWLNRYFSLLELSEDKNIISFLQNGEYRLIPNQYGEFCLPNDLYNDTGIENSLKDIGSQLVTDYYEILCNTFVTISRFLKTKSQKDIIDEINNHLISDDTNEDDKKVAVYSLTSLFPPVETPLYQTKNLIFDISKKIFEDHTFEQQFIYKWSSDIWEVSDKMQVEYITYEISEYGSLLNLSNALSESYDQVREWLSVFINLIVERNWNYLLTDDSPIVPNQNGAFCDVNDLFAEGEPIDESLKNIALQLRRDFRDELIDTAFKVKIPKNRHKFQKDVAIEIRSLVTPLLSEVSRKPQTQSIFNELIIWMDSNQDLAKELFEDLFENRHKLYDDAEVASNLRKVRDLEKEITNLRQTNSNLKNENDQLKAEIEKLKESIDTSDKKDISLALKEIDEDFLIAYGVTSIDQINSIISDPRISQKYILSFQAFDMVSKLQYVLEIIERAKINVREYLESHAEYDCSNWYEIGTTHITGILKHHQKIEIIVRPSDNKKIVFYYPDEIQTLSLSNSELWVEDGNSNPQQITLGVVLQIEGIECLYLR